MIKIKTSMGDGELPENIFVEVLRSQSLVTIPSNTIRVGDYLLGTDPEKPDYTSKGEIILEVMPVVSVSR